MIKWDFTMSDSAGVERGLHCGADMCALVQLCTRVRSSLTVSSRNCSTGDIESSDGAILPAKALASTDIIALIQVRMRVPEQ